MDEVKYNEHMYDFAVMEIVKMMLHNRVFEYMMNNDDEPFFKGAVTVMNDITVDFMQSEMYFSAIILNKAHFIKMLYVLNG